MKPQLKILKGARAGHTEVFSKTEITIGRHPTSDLTMHADHDLRTSARHAVIVLREGHWYVRDVGSRNGTFVNGHRITRDTKLDDTDQIRLGDEDAPVIEVRLVPDVTPDGVTAPARGVPETAAEPTPSTEETGRPKARPTAPAQRSSTTERIRIEVGRQTKALRVVAGVLFGALVIVGAFFIVRGNRQEQQREREIATIQARTDSALRDAAEAMQALEGRVAGLANRLQASQDQVGDLQRQLLTAQQTGTPAEVEELKRQLADATQSLSYQQAAAQVDYRSIISDNQYAVSLIWARFADRTVNTGTGFTVRRDGTILTNRHVVAGEDGLHRPIEIAVKFAESKQVWYARVVKLAADVDLAVIRVEGIKGEITIVRGFSERAAQGDPVAIIGFPLGTDLPGAGAQGIAKTTFTAGTVSKVMPDLIQIDGYGAAGASGSPIFDRSGKVIAILYGGEAGSAGRIIYAIPARRAIDFLASLR